MKNTFRKWKGLKQIILPRWAVPLVWAVLVLLIQVLLPWGISRLGPSFGWSEVAPGNWNLAGLIPIAIGLGLYCWCLADHFINYPTSVRIGLTPPVLVVTGLYKFSRNPMYLAALIAWLGWTIFYGSLTVLIALVLLWSMFSFRVVPLEERQLEAMFGDDYLDYKRSVPRWIGWV